MVYLAGQCGGFTATAGVDSGDPGTVTFSVLLDGRSSPPPPVLNGTSTPLTIDVPLTDGQVLDLSMGDGGDGNGHGDRANPLLSCG